MVILSLTSLRLKHSSIAVDMIGEGIFQSGYNHTLCKAIKQKTVQLHLFYLISMSHEHKSNVRAKTSDSPQKTHQKFKPGLHQEEEDLQRSGRCQGKEESFESEEEIVEWHTDQLSQEQYSPPPALTTWDIWDELNEWSHTTTGR